MVNDIHTVNDTPTLIHTYRWTWIWQTQWDQENWSVICKICRMHMTNTWYASDWDQAYRPSYAKIRHTVVRHIQVHLYTHIHPLNRQTHSQTNIDIDTNIHPHIYTHTNKQMQIHTHTNLYQQTHFYAYSWTQTHWQTQISLSKGSYEDDCINGIDKMVPIHVYQAF